MSKTPDIRNSKRMKEVNLRLEDLNKQTVLARKERADLYKSQKLDCPTCEKKISVGDLFLITGMTYHKSYGSYEDSSWDSNGRWYSVCPCCSMLWEYESKEWVKEFEPFFMKFVGGSLEKRDSSEYNGKISVMMQEVGMLRWYSTEINVPYSAIATAVDGKIPNLNSFRK